MRQPVEHDRGTGVLAHPPCIERARAEVAAMRARPSARARSATPLAFPGPSVRGQRARPINLRARRQSRVRVSPGDLSGFDSGRQVGLYCPAMANALRDLISDFAAKLTS